jgi:hypothetical protein
MSVLLGTCSALCDLNFNPVAETAKIKAHKAIITITLRDDGLCALSLTLSCVLLDPVLAAPLFPKVEAI